MQFSKLVVFTALFVAFCPAQGGRGGDDQEGDKDDKKPHHHHHHKHHQAAAVSASVKVQHAVAQNATKEVEDAHQAPASPPGLVPMTVTAPEIEQKISQMESEIASGKATSAAQPARGTIEVSTPLPPNFAHVFSEAVAQAGDVTPADIKVISMDPSDQAGVADVVYEAPTSAVFSLQNQAGDPNSKLAHSPIRSFLMAKDDDDNAPAAEATATKQVVVSLPPARSASVTVSSTEPCEHTSATYKGDPANIDIDTLMPYGELEPFGREDTAQELTERSVKESDLMVDQLERAEVAEEKRAVFRALTRLRGAAITSFDGVARSQTGNIDEYNKVHHWRSVHPLHHLADEEADISKWAFPDNAD